MLLWWFRGIFGFGWRDEGRADGYGGRFGGYKSIISICFLVRIKAHLPRSHFARMRTKCPRSLAKDGLCPPMQR